MIRAWADSSLKGSLKNMTAEAQLHAPGYLDDPDMQHHFPEPKGKLLTLLNSAVVANWSPRIRIPAIVQSEYETLPVSLVGINPQQEANISFYGGSVKQGKMLLNSHDPNVVIGRHLAQRLKTTVGKRIVIMANDANGKLQERGARVAGIFNAEPSIEDSYMFTGLIPAQQFLQASGQISEIAIMSAPALPLSSLMQRLSIVAPQLDAADWSKLQPMTKGIHDITDSFIYVWLLVMFVLIAIGVVNTQLMAVFERTREFGLLQALGFHPSWIMLEVLLESVQIIGLGVLVGALAAVLTVYSLQDGISLAGLSAGADFLGIERVLYPRLEAKEFTITVAVIWGLGVLTALWPARRAIRCNAIEAMRST